MIRLSKHLQQAGIASRRKAEALILEGKVKVNGEPVIVPQTLIDPTRDQIKVQGKSVEAPEEKVYFLLNKPKGLLCTALGTGHGRSVLALFANENKRLFTVGRLDKDTEGLLLVTNDGAFAQEVIHPSRNLAKEYLAKTAQEITHEHLIKISSGGLVEGTFVKPLKVEKVRKGTLKITLGEGKKREVRVLLDQAGLTVLSLTRIRLGDLVLGPLAVGEYRPLTVKEKERLTQRTARQESSHAPH